MGRGRVANARLVRIPDLRAATLKPQEAKVVRTRGTDTRNRQQVSVCTV